MLRRKRNILYDQLVITQDNMTFLKSKNNFVRLKSFFKKKPAYNAIALWFGFRNGETFTLTMIPANKFSILPWKFHQKSEILEMGQLSPPLELSAIQVERATLPRAYY